MKEEDLEIGDIIMVNFGDSYNKAKIIAKSNNKVYFNLCGMYSGCISNIENREWWFVRKSFYNWVKSLFI